jgi:cell division protein FtsN
MSRDYRPQRAVRQAPRRNARGGTLLGIFIGLVLGLGIAAAVFYYISRSPSPFQNHAANGGKDTPRLEGAPGKPGNGPADKPRFDFYKILPGTEEPKATTTEPKPAPANEAKPAEAKPAEAKSPPPETAAKTPPAKTGEQVYLQAGSFTNPADAENERARLALLGFEAGIQKVTLADKSVRHRVRLGPFSSVEEMNRNKAELARRGVEATVVKNP